MGTDLGNIQDSHERVQTVVTLIINLDEHCLFVWAVASRIFTFSSNNYIAVLLFNDSPIFIFDFYFL